MADALTTAVAGYGNYGIGSQGIYDQSGKAVLPLINAAQAQSDPQSVLAQILKGQWTDYETIYKPLKDAMQASTTYNGNAGLLPTLIDQGNQTNNAAFAATTGMQQRSAAGMGIAPTAREASALTTSNGMAKGLAQVTMENQARQTQSDLNRQIVAGMPSQQDVKNAFG